MKTNSSGTKILCEQKPNTNGQNYHQRNKSIFRIKKQVVSVQKKYLKVKIYSFGVKHDF